MTTGHDRLGLQPLTLTPEERQRDRIDLLQSENDRLRTLNNDRGARLASLRELIGTLETDPKMKSTCSRLRKAGGFR